MIRRWLSKRYTVTHGRVVAAVFIFLCAGGLRPWYWGIVLSICGWAVLGGDR